MLDQATIQLEIDAISDLCVRMEEKYGEPNWEKISEMRTELGW